MIANRELPVLRRAKQLLDEAEADKEGRYCEGLMAEAAGEAGEITV